MSMKQKMSQQMGMKQKMAMAMAMKQKTQQCPCDCVSEEPLWNNFDWANQIYINPGCGECNRVVDEGCWTIEKATADKAAALKLAED